MDVRPDVSVDKAPERWSELLEDGMGSRMFHSTARMSFVTWEEHRTPVFIVFRDATDGHPVGLASIDQYTPSVPILGRYLKYWALAACPILLPNGDKSQIRIGITEALEAAARRHGAVMVRCSSRGGVFGWEDTFKCYEPIESHEFVLRAQPEDEMRSGLASGRKSDLNKAVRNDIAIRKLDAEEVRRSTHPEELASLERTTEAKSRSIGRSQDYAGWNAEHYQALTRTLLPAGEAHLFTARSSNGDFVGLAVLLTYGADGYLLHAAYSREGYTTGAPTLLWWELFMFAHREGIERVNLGAVPAGADQKSSPDNGLYRFKESFGAEPMPWIDFQHKVGAWRMSMVRKLRPDTYR